METNDIAVIVLCSGILIIGLIGFLIIIIDYWREAQERKKFEKEIIDKILDEYGFDMQQHLDKFSVESDEYIDSMKKRIGDLTLREFKKNVCDKQNNCHNCKYWNSYDSECSPIPEIIRHYDNDEIEVEENE